MMHLIKNFGEFIEFFQDPVVPPSQSWLPVIFSLDANEEDTFYRFCKDNHLELIDTIDHQLDDLAKIKFPATGDEYKRRQFIAEQLGHPKTRSALGNWVYLPWQMKIVHVLEEYDYFDVITNRNQLKINRDEQNILKKKRVGVIGLSVGAEAAITVAQEHLCGEIVIADFDKLDLSNLNRLNARFDEIGIPKTIIAARRIVGINPYMSVKIFEEGVNDDNVDEFLDGLDLLIEECDDLTMKFKIRQIAKRKRLNIVFAADERGMLSIEPYQYCKDLPEFHGRVSKVPPPKDAFSNQKDFMLELTEWLGGWEAISERSKTSVENIGVSLCGYPQLASEARLAAAQVAYVSRRLLLGEKLTPFINHLDLEEFLWANS